MNRVISQVATVAAPRTQRGEADRRQVSGSEQYEVSYFAARHGLTMNEARNIIRQADGSRERAGQLAVKFKS
jgi:hypothetical protein